MGCSSVTPLPRSVDCFVQGRPDGELRACELCHGRVLPERLSPVLQASGLVYEQPCGLDPRCHVGQLERDALEATDGLTELTPFPRVAQGHLVRALSQAETHGRDRDAATVEDLK